MKIITVTGYKGGIGKSTTAFHLASYFSDLGKTVLIDGDPNRIHTICDKTQDEARFSAFTVGIISVSTYSTGTLSAKQIGNAIKVSNTIG